MGWRKTIVASEDVDFKWRNTAGTIVEKPEDVVVSWRNTKTGAVTRRMLSPVVAPPLHHELAFFTYSGEAYELGNDAPVWVRAGTLEAVELTPAMRSRIQWQNSRTKAISLVDPLGTA